MRIPGLEKLVIEFGLWEEWFVSLSWVRAQACKVLHMKLQTHIADPEAHSELTDQLQQLSITKLRLEMFHSFPLDLQHMWQRVSASECCNIHFKRHAAVEDTQTLQAVPCSPCMTLVMFQGGTWNVHWSAVVAQSAQYSVWPTSRGELNVLGGCDLPAELESRPWQLVIHGKAYGLYAAQWLRSAKPGFPVCYVQNAAAVAAGWTIHS